MSVPTCACCGKPLADGATVCHADAQGLAQRLREAAGHAEDAQTVIARQARYGTSGGARKAEPEPTAATEANRRNPVNAFGWQASVERPKAGGLRAEPIPVDLGASGRLADVTNVITTWARHVCEERGTELPARRPMLGPRCDDCLHASCAGIGRRLPPSALSEAAAWLATQVDWLRMRPEAEEAFDELTDACTRLRALVDRPADRLLVGMCDCGKVLYAAPGRQVVQCREPKCELRWDVERSREILMQHLNGTLVTAAEGARLAAYLSDRTQDAIRKLISSRTRSGQLAVRGVLGGEATYRFGEIVSMLAAVPRRNREGVAA
jgi:hypothetical protein